MVNVCPSSSFRCRSITFTSAAIAADLDWIVGPKVSARDRTVVLVDDILDEGTTLSAIEEFFLKEGASEVRKAVLVVKKRMRAQAAKIDFAGLEVPDRYVFGYGMDYKGYLRNAPGIYAEREYP